MSHEDAEEICQEVFLTVIKSLKSFQEGCQFQTWLFRIATNLALNSLRDTRYRRMEVSLDAPVTVDAEEGEEKTVDIAEKHPNIPMIIEHLSEDDVPRAKKFLDGKFKANGL